MSQTIHQLVTDQFAPVAASYTTSAVHADKDALSELLTLVNPRPQDELLDVATGAGHVALTFAPYVARSVAFDLTPSMLQEAATTAKTRGIDNLETVQGLAESLPFPDGSFDIYTVRLAPHHFADVAGSVKEAFRVLRPGGKYLVVDTASPEDEVLDREIDLIERLRDPSHVRNYKGSEWKAMAEDAGFRVETLFENFCGTGRPMDFDEWVIRMRTPAENVIRLRALFNNASSELMKVLDVSFEGDKIGFRLPQVNMLAIKP